MQEALWQQTGQNLNVADYASIDDTGFNAHVRHVYAMLPWRFQEVQTWTCQER